MSSDTFSNNSYQQLIPILQTHFDYYSSEDPVSVDSITSSDDDSTSTVILLKSSVEVNVDEPDSHDQNLPSLSHLQALPDYDYLLFHDEKEDVIKSKYGKWDGIEYPNNSQSFSKDGPLQGLEHVAYGFDKTSYEMNFTQNKRENMQTSNIHTESGKTDLSHKTLANNNNNSYPTLSKGNFRTATIFI